MSAELTTVPFGVRLRSFAAWKLRPLLTPLFRRAADRSAVRFQGQPFEVHRDDDIVSYLLWATATWDPLGLETCRAALPEGGTFVDVGANIGVFSACAAVAVGQGGTVHAVEPAPRNLATLKANTQNGPASVHIHEVAAGDAAGSVHLHVDGNPGHFAVGSEGGAQSIEVPCCRLDDLLPQEDVHVLKIDVEGYEMHVLAGAMELIRKSKPLIYCEMWLPEGGGTTIQEDVMSGLENLGYGAAFKNGHAKWGIVEPLSDVVASLREGPSDVLLVPPRGAAAAHSP